MKKETMEKQEERARTVYTPPRAEVYEAKPDRLMGNTSFYSEGHNIADGPDDNSDHTPGNLILPTGSDSSNGAKILGWEFSFSDLWEE